MDEKVLDQEQELLGEDEQDIVDFYDDEGNLLQLEVMDYFFYNGDEFAVLIDADAECDCDDHEDECDCEVEQDLYIMKVVNSTNDEGEEMEEFLPVEDDLLEKLIPIVQQRYSDEGDDDDDDDDDLDDDDFDDDDDDDDDDDNGDELDGDKE
ncbi:MAG: DUF1292 domain-containing protein [Oscillospiraceae bacterium]|jgi:hypothetical protein|nr:DUF1292 domain-containing protein [Oscillospiraceae bacterium]